MSPSHDSGSKRPVRVSSVLKGLIDASDASLKKQAEVLSRHADVEPQHLHGAVALIDALGVRDRDIAAAHEFLKERANVLHTVRQQVEQNKAMNQLLASGAFSRGKRQHRPAKPHEPSIVTFGDTLLIASGSKDSEAALGELLDVASLVNTAIYAGIEVGLLWRGAIAVGEFLLADQIVLGPAISDAVGWYERADWVGAVLTPRTAMVASSVMTDNWQWIDYDVPTRAKDGKTGTTRLAALTWPVGPMLDPALGPDVTLRRVKAALGRRPIPVGAESKALNTVRFAEHVQTQVVPGVAKMLKDASTPDPPSEPRPPR